METRAVTLNLQKSEPSETYTTTPRDAALRKRVMQIEDEETRNYLLDRVLPQMTWYSQKAARYRATYYRLMAANISLCALIPAFAICADSDAVKALVALCGTSAMGINAYLSLCNYKSLWTTYQKAREALSHTLFCYFNRAGEFKPVAPERANTLLVNACEDIIKKG